MEIGLERRAQNQSGLTHKFWVSLPNLENIIIPHACAKGKVIIVVVNKYIASSGHLGTLATCKHDKSVKFDEKLCFESSGMAYKCHK